MACWCHLTYPQKHYHLPNHSAYIKTAGQYSEKESFTKLTIEYGHFAEKNLIKYLFKIKEKPPVCMQTKKEKKVRENSPVKKSEAIPIDLSKTSLKKNGLLGKDLNPANELLNTSKTPSVQKKVIFSFSSLIIYSLKNFKNFQI